MTQHSWKFSDISVLITTAHPDDEAFGCGGTLAMLVAKGARVTLVCATNGDVGEISDPALATPETLAQVRQEELRQAMEVTGIKDLRFMGFRDSGMPGTRDNNHPDALYQADPDRVIDQLVAIIREVRPEVVITHDPTGGYGHPDHIATSAQTTRAFSLAGDSDYVGSVARGADPWAPHFLYYVCLPRSVLRKVWQQMLDSGITPPFAKDNIESLGTPDEDVTTVLDVSSVVDTKIASLLCHRTQIGANGPFAKLPEDYAREMMSTEYFTLAVPEGADRDTDLLASLE